MAGSLGAELDWAGAGSEPLLLRSTHWHGFHGNFLTSRTERSRRWVLSMLSHPKVGGHKEQRRLRSQACPGTQGLRN